MGQRSTKVDTRLADMVTARQQAEVWQERAFQRGLKAELGHFTYRREEILSAIEESKKLEKEYGSFNAYKELAGADLHAFQQKRINGQLPEFIAQFEPDLQAQWQADQARTKSAAQEQEPTAATTYGRAPVTAEPSNQPTLERE